MGSWRERVGIVWLRRGFGSSGWGVEGGDREVVVMMSDDFFGSVAAAVGDGRSCAGRDACIRGSRARRPRKKVLRITDAYLQIRLYRQVSG